MSELNYLPAVLHGRGRNSGISVYRALQQAKILLEQFPEGDDAHNDRVNATLDDLEFMLQCVQ